MARASPKLVSRAMILALDGDYRAATTIMSRLLDRSPTNADLWTDRGHVYEFWAAAEYERRRITRAERDRIYRKAARDYSRALSLKPTSVRALVDLGDYHDAMGAHARAIRYYDRAIEAGGLDAKADNDGLADAYLGKCVVFRALDRHAEARACVRDYDRLRRTGRRPPATRRG